MNTPPQIRFIPDGGGDFKIVRIVEPYAIRLRFSEGRYRQRRKWITRECAAAVLGLSVPYLQGVEDAMRDSDEWACMSDEERHLSS